MRREVSTTDELRGIVGHPNTYVANKVGNRLSPIQRDWLAHSPLGFVATTDVEGRVDVSPKGDPPGLYTSSTTPRSRYLSGRATSGWTATSTCWSGRTSARCS